MGVYEHPGAGIFLLGREMADCVGGHCGGRYGQEWGVLCRVCREVEEDDICVPMIPGLLSTTVLDA